MTAPSPDARFPFTTESVPLAPLLDGATGDILTEPLLAYIRQSFALRRASDAWPRGKRHQTPAGDVDVYKAASGQKGKFAKAAWHGRLSHHRADNTFGLEYDDFRSGLLLEHTRQETQYIHECVETAEVCKPRPSICEVWNNGYHLPSISSNRDFVPLLITIDLPPSPEPFSEEHERHTLSLYADPKTTLTDVQRATPPPPPASSEASAAAAAGTGTLRRSFMVIQLPVQTDLCKERTAEGYVRGSYASVESVSEDGKGGVDWNMFVQSNAGGRVPLFFQEMAMPGKIHPDVPSFILWAKDHRDELKEKKEKHAKSAGGGGASE